MKTNKIIKVFFNSNKLLYKFLTLSLIQFELDGSELL